MTCIESTARYNHRTIPRQGQERQSEILVSIILSA